MSMFVGFQINADTKTQFEKIKRHMGKKANYAAGIFLSELAFDAREIALTFLAVRSIVRNAAFARRQMRFTRAVFSGPIGTKFSRFGSVPAVGFTGWLEMETQGPTHRHLRLKASRIGGNERRVMKQQDVLKKAGHVFSIEDGIGYFPMAKANKRTGKPERWAITKPRDQKQTQAGMLGGLAAQGYQGLFFIKDKEGATWLARFGRLEKRPKSKRSRKIIMVQKISDLKGKSNRPRHWNRESAAAVMLTKGGTNGRWASAMQRAVSK